MKTSTLLLLGGAVAVGYYIAKRKASPDRAVTQTELARTAPSTQVVIVPPEIDDYYGPGWGWSAPVWGGRAWRSGGGHHHGHGGHGHHGGHH